MKATQEKVQAKRLATMKRLSQKHDQKYDVRQHRHGLYVAIKWQRVVLGEHMPPDLARTMVRIAAQFTHRRFRRDK